MLKEGFMAFDVVEKNKQFLVIGLGTFGTNVALSLVEEGVEVIAIDNNKENVDRLKDKLLNIYYADSTNEDALRNIGIESVDCAIVCMGTDMIASILTTLLLKKLKVPRVYARANTIEHTEILRMIGVTEVIQPEVETARKVAKKLAGSGGYLISYEEISKSHAIVELKVTGKIDGKTLSELDFRKNFKINVIAVKRLTEKLDEEFRALNEYEINEVPDPNEPLSENDILIIIGKNENIRRLHDYLIGKSE